MIIKLRLLKIHLNVEILHVSKTDEHEEDSEAPETQIKVLQLFCMEEEQEEGTSCESQLQKLHSNESLSNIFVKNVFAEK